MFSEHGKHFRKKRYPFVVLLVALESVSFRTLSYHSESCFLKSTLGSSCNIFCKSWTAQEPVNDICTISQKYNLRAGLVWSVTATGPSPSTFRTREQSAWSGASTMRREEEAFWLDGVICELFLFWLVHWITVFVCCKLYSPVYRIFCTVPSDTQLYKKTHLNNM